MLLLRKKTAISCRVDGSVLRPDKLTNLTKEEVESLPIATESGNLPIGMVFEVESIVSRVNDILLIEGDCHQVDGIGKRMESGTLCVLGDVGDRLAQGIRGGKVLVVGNANDHVGAGMKDGLVYISGNCGNNMASPLPGHKSGMRGGDILVAGNAGDRVCERMRRGTVYVAGDVGSYAVSQMIAGTLVVAGELGDHWGAGIRRGSLILFKDFAGDPLASLSEAREFELSFLPLLWKHLERTQAEILESLTMAMANSAGWIQPPIREVPASLKIPKTRWVQRQIADLNFQGRGEVLVLRRFSSPEVRM